MVYSTLLYSTVLYCTALYCTVLYCTVPYSTELYSTVLYSTLLQSTVLYCTVLYSTVLYCTLPYFTTRTRHGNGGALVRAGGVTVSRADDKVGGEASTARVANVPRAHPPSERIFALGPTAALAAWE
jgi:hypothetical protein